MGRTRTICQSLEAAGATGDRAVLAKDGSIRPSLPSLHLAIASCAHSAPTTASLTGLLPRPQPAVKTAPLPSPLPLSTSASSAPSAPRCLVGRANPSPPRPNPLRRLPHDHIQQVRVDRDALPLRPGRQGRAHPAARHEGASQGGPEPDDRGFLGARASERTQPWSRGLSLPSLTDAAEKPKSSSCAGAKPSNVDVHVLLRPLHPCLLPLRQHPPFHIGLSTYAPPPTGASRCRQYLSRSRHPREVLLPVVGAERRGHAAVLEAVEEDSGREVDAVLAAFAGWC